MTLRHPVVLASGSPRRRDLLLELIDDFEIFVPDVDEDALTGPDPHQTALELAKAKAHAVKAHRPDCVVVAGDTVVALPAGNGKFKQFAKPRNAKDAEKMLGQLASKTHLVITGVCVIWPDDCRAFVEETQVTFRELEPDEIKKYVATGEPMDKAGAYACQGGAKGFITAMEGSLTNVVGLPLEALEPILVELQ